MKSSVLSKVFLAGAMALVLLAPLRMIQSVIDDRSQRRESAIAEVSEKWGRSQALIGPILTVPYRVLFREKDGEVRTRKERAQFLPETLVLAGVVQPEVRRRGIFDVVLYGLELSMSGTFSPDLETLGVPAADVLWDEAFVTFGISDTRGIKEQLRLSWDGAELPMKPSAGGAAVVDAGIHAPLPPLLSSRSPHRFALTLRLQGSESLTFAPLGVETRVDLRSPWSHPSFAGAFLPESRDVSPRGFTARWRVSHFGRNTPQHWRSEGLDLAALKSALASSSFGVLFFQPADHYQQATRSVKYAVLFVGLTFGAFFLFEVLAGLRLHPLHYLLVGFALALFYLLLVSLSEQIGFGAAYAAAAAATVALVSAYSARILARSRRALVIGGLLAALYGYLYVLLRVEDFALLLGSLALFALLSLTMYVTRNVDWWSAGGFQPRGAPPTGERPA